MERENHIRQLLQRYADNSLTPAEERELFDYLQSADEDDTWVNVIQEMIVAEPVVAEYDPEKWEPVIAQLKKQNRALDVENIAPVRSINKYWRVAGWAAAVVIALLTGYFTIFRQPGNDGLIANNSAKTDSLVADLPPGSNKAILTRADGTTIVLDDMADGVLSDEGNAKLIKTGDGQVAYLANETEGTEVVYNTMTTPRGGQYKLTLPDGTAVWLNAASSITYPTTFNADKRIVSISGEAYFEVASLWKGAGKVPFIVEIKEQNTSVEVLGTHFNINAYADELVTKTTLLEGAVNVVSGNSGKRLVPGQQAQTSKGRQVSLVSNVNTVEAVAWKNGGFYFDGADIQTIMRQIERWYNVKVQYKGQMPHGHYRGQPSRNLPLSKMLEVLKYSGLNYQVEGTIITILE